MGGELSRRSTSRAQDSWWCSTPGMAGNRPLPPAATCNGWGSGSVLLACSSSSQRCSRVQAQPHTHSSLCISCVLPPPVLAKGVAEHLQRQNPDSSLPGPNSYRAALCRCRELGLHQLGTAVMQCQAE